MEERIEIVSYRPEWPSQFEQIKHLLKTSLRDLCLSIDHIGSTSVPGLQAKNRIDVQITVNDLSGRFKAALDTQLVSGGFPASRENHDHRPPGDQSKEAEWEKLYVSGTHADLKFRSNIHIRKLGLRNWRYPLLFRDYLRAHPGAAEAYARAKEKLARYLADDRDAYTDAKDPICDLVMMQAEIWATGTAWVPKIDDTSSLTG